MQLCDYGCGQEGKHYFPTVDKWCCNKNISNCLFIKNKISQKNSGNKVSEETRKRLKEVNKGKILSKETRKKMSESHIKNPNATCFKKGNIPWNKGKTGIYSKETLKKISEGSIGREGYWKGKSKSKDHKEKIGMSKRITIRKIKKRYSFFSQIEEMRYNPDKLGEKEIQVHCKNHLCENSKEKGGWFTPSRSQLNERIRQLEHLNGNDGSYFYCSLKCKEKCPLYNLHSDPFKEYKKIYTQEEYETFKEFVLERDNYKCQYCGKKAKHVHHERPQKLEPFFALDLDFAWSCCEQCHYKYGHKTESECSTGNLASKVCI